MTVKESWRRSLSTSVAAAHVRIVERRVTSRKSITRFGPWSNDVCVYCSHVGRNQLLRWKLKVEV